MVMQLNETIFQYACDSAFERQNSFDSKALDIYQKILESILKLICTSNILRK